MILFTIILLALIGALAVLLILGISGLLVFGDLILCMVIIGFIINRILDKRGT